MKFYYKISFSVVLILAGLITDITAQNTLTLSIDSAKSTIKKAIYGALMENWGRDIYNGIYVGRGSSIPNTNGMRNDGIDGLKECGIGTIEFPGGCFADNYHWKDGIGTYSTRPRGDMSNGMGTDEYMQLCSLVNAEPYICANLNTGTPDEMKEWINYINANASHPEWHVQYWSMGNEPWGCGGNLSATAFADQYKKFVAAVPTIPGKSLLRIAGAGAYGTDWVDAIYKVNDTSTVDGFSVHRYLVKNWDSYMAGPSFNYSDFQFHEIINMAYGVTDFVKSFDNAMSKYDPEKKAGLMFNEWGAWYQEISSQGYTFSQSTVRDALIAAIHLNTFNNYCERVHMACVAQPFNVIQSLFLTDKTDQNKMVKTPVFYTFKLFKVHQNAKKIPITLQTSSFNETVQGTNFKYPYLTASASLDSTKNVNITISNSDLVNDQNLTILLCSSDIYQSVSGKVITASAVTALNDFDKPEQVNIQTFSSDNFSLSEGTLTVKIPSKSVILLTLTPLTLKINPSLSSQSNRNNFSIKTAVGKIVIGYSAAPKKPVNLTLIGIDGRVVSKTSVTAQQSVNNQIVWQPQGLSVSNGMYLLRIETDGISISQKVTLAH